MSTGKTRIERRPATQADLVKVLGRLPTNTVRAWVWTDGDEILGAVGWYMAGTRAIVFSEMSADAPKMTIWRESRRFMDELKLPAMCVAQKGSERFLTRLGWTWFYSGPDGEVFQCNS